ncbi:MAG: hypothetical protein EBZ05_06530 [Verrucomicrobia bacterium]|jgi:hypothetical protein|nr:hypothetical protein [Verrucomicrobiota bacterium]NDA26478.1 hypothetical protein [Verrucomicrobiota bacterium]
MFLRKKALGIVVACSFAFLNIQGQLEAETTNYKEISSYRFVSLRQTSPKGPTIRDFYVFISLGFNQANYLSALILKTPTRKSYGFVRWKISSPWGGNVNYWQQYFGYSANQAKHMSLMPGGKYEIQCVGGILAGQTISLDLPSNLLNPCMPYLEGNSFTILTKGKLDAAKDNTLLVRRLLKTGSPFVVEPQPKGSINRVQVQIRDDSATGEAQFIWYNTAEYDSSGVCSFTIPANKMKKNKVYALSLQTDSDYPDGSVTTPEGQIASRLHGITYYELVFRTAKK